MAARMCIDIAGLNRVASRSSFWPGRAGLGRGANAGRAHMPFSLENIVALGPCEPPGPLEAGDP